MSQQQTRTLSYVGPRDVAGLREAAVKMNGNAIPTRDTWGKLGFGMDSGVIHDMNRYLNVSTGMDASPNLQALLSTPNTGTPLQMLQAMLPGLIRQLTAVRMIDEIMGISIVGAWEMEEVVQGFLEQTGSAVPYTDYGPIPFANFNFAFERRTICRFEEGIEVGRLEELRTAQARINAAMVKRAAAALALDIQRNNIGFYGYNNGLNRTFGLLNEPSLPAYITVAAGAAGGNPTSWNLKTFAEINADIRTAISTLRSQSGGNIAPDKVRCTLLVPTSKYDRLTITTDFGQSSVDFLKKTYPQLRVLSAPELVGANGGSDVFYLYAEETPDESDDDNKTFIQMVQTKFTVLGAEKQAKLYMEDYTNATAGVLLKRPYAVVRFSGI